ncbi:MAG: DUF4402 domain-containing protein [Bacteroidales bacterium]
MKMLKLFLFSAFLIGFSYFATAQTSSSMDAEASITLGAEMRIEKLSDLHFGDITSNSTGGSVLLNPSDGSVSNLSGNFFLLGNSTAARFQISGAINQCFEIATGSYPSQITLTNEYGNTMTVNNFQILPSSGTLGSTGIIEIKVGGTLNINANQPSGNYSNDSDLTITISYQ